MSRDDVARWLVELRQHGVRSASFGADGALTSVEFFHAMVTAPVPDDNRPLPPAKRSLDQRLFDPLGIGETGQPKPGGEG